MVTSPSTIAVFIISISVFIIALLIHKKVVNKYNDELQNKTRLVNEAERQVHIKEMEYLAERNKVMIAHTEDLTQARSNAFEEGRKLGKAEHELDMSMQLSEQRNEFLIQLQSEKDKSATEARDRLRAEYELQTKLFSVKISPYVQILTDNGVFKNSYEAKIGYQFQLLVNGIPAFQPHIYVERHEIFQQVDESIKKALLNTAQLCAEAAVITYLGASPQFAKLSPSVFEQIKK